MKLYQFLCIYRSLETFLRTSLKECILNAQVSAGSGKAKASKEDNADVAEEAAKFADQEWDSIES